MQKKISKLPADHVVRICTAVRRAIIERALAPGDRLPEDSLGESFGVSRTIARQALGQLAAEGLVELRRNRRAVVATPTLEEARDTFDIRRVLETLVVRQLAGTLTDAQRDELISHVDAQAAAEPSADASAIRLATDFHIILARMTGKAILYRYVSEVSYRSALALSAHGRPHSGECAVNEHRNLIDALTAGDEQNAMRLMSDHLDAVAGRAMLSDAQPGQRDLIRILAEYADV